MDGNETALVVGPEQTLFDVTDKSLYSFDDRDSMMMFREASTAMALNRFFSLSIEDFDVARFVVYLAEKIPHIKRVFDSLKGNKELVVKLSEEARRKYEQGLIYLEQAKDDSGLIASFKDAMTGKYVGKVRLEEIIKDQMYAIQLPT